MTQKDREKIVRWHLFKYSEHKREIDDYELNVIYGQKPMDISGVHGTAISDPSARKGMQLIDKPEHIIRNQQWIEAINNGLRELKAMDGGDEHGLNYICKSFYGINKRRIGTVRIAIECALSRASVYNKLQLITTIMTVHAALKGLL